MNPKDELIRRAMLHARYGYAVGGKPGESAAAQAEASRGVSSGTGNVGGIRDGGFGGAGAGSLGGNGGGGNAGMMAGSAGRDGGGGTGAQQVSNAGAKSDFGFAGQPVSNAAAKGNFLTSSTNPLSNYVAPSPDIGTLAYNRALEESIHNINTGMFSMPNLTGTNVPAVAYSGLNVNKPSTVNFGTALATYGGSLPVSRPKTISDYMGSGTSTPPVNGPITQQVNTAGKGDFLGTPASRGVSINNIAPAGSFAGFGLPETPSTNISNLVAGTQPSSYGIPVSDSATFYSSMPSPSAVAGMPRPSALASYMGSPSMTTGPRMGTNVVSASPSIGSVKAADYQSIADAIKGFTPEQTNQLAFGSAYSTRTPTEVGQMIAGLKAAASNPNLSADQQEQLSKDIAALQAMGGIAVSPGSSFAPTPQGFTVNPQTGAITKSPGYNVVAGPYATMDSPVGEFKNISFAMPESVALSQRSIAANPNFAQMPTASNTMMAQGPQSILNSSFDTASNGAPVDLTGLEASPPLEAPRYLREPQTLTAQAPASVTPTSNTLANATTDMRYVQMVPRTPTPPPANANMFQSIANAMLPENLFPNALYTQPTPSGQYLVQYPENTGLFSGYMSEPFRIDRDIGVATIPTTGMPNPNANVITTDSGRQLAFNPATGGYDYVSKFRGSLDDRPGGDNREQNKERSQNRRLLAMGYSQDEIDAMPPDERKELLQTAATGGRIGYRRGGSSESDSESNSSSNPPAITLQPLPEWKPAPMPTYNMPSASPLIANFVGSLSQPIPAVQMPQYQSMVSPLQNTQASFANPTMGSSGTTSGLGVNALRYNPMLMDERPDYALTANDSLSNALRLLKG